MWVGHFKGKVLEGEFKLNDIAFENSKIISCSVDAEFNYETPISSGKDKLTLEIKVGKLIKFTIYETDVYLSVKRIGEDKIIGEFDTDLPLISGEFLIRKAKKKVKKN